MKWADYPDRTERYSYWEMNGWSPAQIYDQGVKPMVCCSEQMTDVTNALFAGRYPRVSYLKHWKSERKMVTGHWEVNGSANLYRRSQYETMVRFPLGNLHAPADPGFGYLFDERLFTKAVEDSSMQEKAQGLPFIAELRQAISMVKNPLKFLQHMRLPRRSRGKTLGQLAALKRSASDGYLTTKYGWKPLISDLNSFAAIVNNLSRNYDSYVNLARHGVTAKVLAKEKSNSSIEGQQPTNPYTESQFVEVRSEHTLTGVLWYSLSPSPEVMSKTDYLMSSLGLTPGELLTTAWELVPYSFVVDWFIPVGDFLNRITHTPSNFSLLDVMYSLRTKSEVKHFRHCDLRTGTPWAPPPAIRVENVATDVNQLYTRGGSEVLPHSTLPWFNSIRPLAALALIEQKLRLPIK